MHVPIAAILNLLRERRFADALEAARALQAQSPTAERPLVDACVALVCWRAGATGGRPVGDGLAEAIAGHALLEQAGRLENLGWVAGSIGYALGSLGDFEAGLEWLSRSVEDARARDDLSQWVSACSLQASLLAYAEEHERAFALFTESLELSQALDPRHGEAVTLRAGLLANLAYCRILQARRVAGTDPRRQALVLEALSYTDQALALGEMSGPRRWRATALDNRGVALLMLGRHDEALSAFDEGLGQPDQSPKTRIELMVDRAEALIVSGDLTTAAELLTQADTAITRDLVDRTQDRILELQITIARRLDRGQEAQALWERRFDQMAKRYRDRLANVRRHTELQMQLKQARAAVRESRLQERESLLQDLHDGFGSQLTSALLRAERTQMTQAEMTLLLGECISDLYLVLDNFSGEERSLAEALRYMRHRCEGRMARLDTRLEWVIDLEGIPSLPPRATLQVLRIVQEALGNALKHAAARTVRIAATRGEPEGVTIRVDDDGRGMPAHGEERNGLRGLRQRARSLGARVAILPLAPGTRIELHVPAGAADDPIQ